MKRNNKWCIYTSSYDRGLEHLLKIWPDVKKSVPESQLHIFYGWELFERFYRDNPASMQWKDKMDEMMKSDGIVNHGRISQPELVDWYKKCGLWTYPTHFGEISCISAMKAQAWGAIPIVINYAALMTTVKYGVKIKGDINEEKIREEYKIELISKLKDDKWQDEIRPKMMKWAKKEFGWDKVAKQWTEEFKRDDLKEAMDAILAVNKDYARYLPLQMQEKYGHNECY